MKRINLKVEDKLHAKYRMLAFKEGISLNDRIVKAMQSDFKKSKNADTLIEKNYKDLLSPEGRNIKK